MKSLRPRERDLYPFIPRHFSTLSLQLVLDKMCLKYLIFEFRKKRVGLVMRQYHFSSLTLSEADRARPRVCETLTFHVVILALHEIYTPGLED